MLTSFPCCVSSCNSFSPTDNKFATCSDDGTVRIWDFLRCHEERILRGMCTKRTDWDMSKGKNYFVIAHRKAIQTSSILARLLILQAIVSQGFQNSASCCLFFLLLKLYIYSYSLLLELIVTRRKLKYLVSLLLEEDNVRNTRSNSMGFSHHQVPCHSCPLSFTCLLNKSEYTSNRKYGFSTSKYL